MPEALAAAGRVEQRRQLLERAPERAAGAGGVLEVQRAALASRPAPPRSTLPARSIALRDVALLGRAGVQDDADGADRRRRRAATGSATPATSSRISGSSVAQLSR